MESLFIQFKIKIHPYDWFCDLGSYMHPDIIKILSQNICWYLNLLLIYEKYDWIQSFTSDSQKTVIPFINQKPKYTI